MQKFYSSVDLAEVTGYGKRTVYRDVAIMRKLIPKGIYSLNDFCGKNIRLAAYQHYKNNQKLLELNPSKVKPFGGDL